MAGKFLAPIDVCALHKTMKRSLTFFHLNAQSVRNKEDDLHALLSRFSFTYDVIMISETWYQNDCEVLKVAGYTTHYLNRTVKKGGGVLLMAEKSLNLHVVPDYTKMTDDFEALTVSDSHNVFSVLYRPPNGNTAAFSTFLDKFISWANETEASLVIGGDMNINLLHPSPAQRDLLVVLESNACTNTINVPTRVQNNTETLLDLFITNYPTSSSFSGVIGVHISDHLPIFLITNLHKPRRSSDKEEQVSFQYVNPISLEEFRSAVLNIDWSEIYNMVDPDLAYNSFLHLFKSTYIKHFPNKTKTCNRKCATEKLENLGLQRASYFK